MLLGYRYAGVGQDYNASSAVDVVGVPPRMISVAVTYSAYNGINVTMPSAPIVMKNCTFRNNRGPINCLSVSTNYV